MLPENVQRLDVSGKRLLIDGVPKYLIDEIVPRSYLRSNGSVSVTLSYEAVLLLSKAFPAMRISLELQHWCARIKQQRQTTKDLFSGGTARLYVVPRAAPELFQALRTREYQVATARFVADNNRVLLAHEPGLGKTLMAIAGIIEGKTPGPHLVVAPKTAGIPVWGNELHRWLPKARVFTMQDSRSYRESVLSRAFGENDWVVVNPRMVSLVTYLVCAECGAETKESRDAVLDCAHDGLYERVHYAEYEELYWREWGSLIVDECHETLIKRTSMTQQRKGLISLRLRKDGKRIALSGTPFESKPHQLWGTLNFLDSTAFASMSGWVELFWRTGGYTGHQVGAIMEDREELLWDSLGGIMIRKTKAEVAKDLPPKQYVGTPLEAADASSPVGVWIPMDARQKSAYDEMEALSLATLEGGEVLEAISALEELTRLKQMACSYGKLEPRRKERPKYLPAMPSNKLTWIMDRLDEWGIEKLKGPEGRIVVVSQFTSLLMLADEVLNKQYRPVDGRPFAVGINGSVSLKDRVRLIEEFNEGGSAYPRAMLLQVKSGGTAITLHAESMFFLSETGVPTQQLQAEDRIHRISSSRTITPTYYYLRSLGTVDEGIAYDNKMKLDDTYRLLDIRRNVTPVRRVIDIIRSSHRKR